jgi:hypothetical protein
VRLVSFVLSNNNTLPESKGQGLYSRVKKFNFKQSISDRLRLPDKLIQSLFFDRSIALPIDIFAIGFSRRLAINSDPKLYSIS